MSNNNLAVHPLTRLFENEATQFCNRRSFKGVNVISKPVLIDGIEYPSISSASRKLKVSASVITKRLSSDEYPNYQLLNVDSAVALSTAAKRKAVYIEGTVYASVSEASRILHVSKSKLLYRVSTKRPGYYYTA